MISILGLLLSVVVIVILVYRGLNTIPVTIIASLVIIVSNGMSPWDTFVNDYCVAMKNFAGSYFLMFLLAAIFGAMMDRSGAAFSISYWLMKKLGKQRVILIMFATTLILTYAGISTYLVAFTLYPIAIALFRVADIPKKLFPASVLGVAATITMTMLPGTPSVQNLIPTQYLGTTIYSGPIIGIVCSIMTFYLNYRYLMREQKKLALAGEHFVPGANDSFVNMDECDISQYPGLFASIMPVIILIVTIFILKGKVDPVYSLVIGMGLAVIIGMLIFRRRESLNDVVNNGSKNGVFALLVTAAVLGFGGVVNHAPAFQSFVALVNNISMDPFISSAISINIFSAITGSAAGGLGIFFYHHGSKTLIGPCEYECLASCRHDVLRSAGCHAPFKRTRGGKRHCRARSQRNLQVLFRDLCFGAVIGNRARRRHGKIRHCLRMAHADRLLRRQQV
ncbi:hypothetical protein ABK905_20110 [Acerihabitans sp. KWT182]|uniref:GntP family permease n=1 Tax=Acerihabitans sp. KWT182 TaxID=3157919 RepID=A0AAU7Q834_9GAMM